MTIVEFFQTFVGSSTPFISEIFGAALMLVVVYTAFSFVLGSISSIFTFRGR